jgi:hypothetical protein
MSDTPKDADASKSGSDDSTVNTEQIQEELAAAKAREAELQKQIDSMKPKLEDWEKTKQQRDTARKEKEAELEKQQEYKALSEQRAERIAELEKQLSEFDSLKDIQSKYEQLQLSTKAEILSSLKERVDEDTYKELEQQPLETLRIVAKTAPQKPTAPKIGGKDKGNGGNIDKPFDQYTTEEIASYIEANGQQAWTKKVMEDMKSKRQQK